MPGLRVPDKAIDGALKFYSDRQSPGDGKIGYQPRRREERRCHHRDRRGRLCLRPKARSPRSSPKPS